MSREPLDVQFRYLAMHISEGEIAGICLSYRSINAAKSFFDFIHRYLSARGSIPRRLIKVRATKRSNGTYRLIIEAGLQSELRRLEIVGIEQQYIEKIRNSLDQFAYYLIAASYELPNGEVSLLPLAENHLFVHHIDIDGIQYEGIERTKVQWGQLIQSDYVVYEENG